MSNQSQTTSDRREHMNLVLALVGVVVTGSIGLLAIQDGPWFLKSLVCVGLFLTLSYLASVLFKHEKGKVLSVLVAFLGVGFICYAASVTYTAWAASNAKPFAQCSNYYDKQAYLEAIDCYKKAGNLGDNFLAKKELGQSYAAVGRRLEAAQTFKDIFNQKPDEVRPLITKVYFDLAFIEHEKGNKQNAIRYQAILRTYDEAMADELKKKIEQ